MIKVNRIQIFLVVFTLVFIMNLQNSKAGPCDNPVVSTVPTQVDYNNLRCTEENKLEWDYSSCDNDNDLDPNSSCSVGVTDGVKPFSWSVSGIDFSLDYSETEIRSNQLNAGSSSCGLAEIKVVDSCGEEIFGYVRAAIGDWNEIDHNGPDTCQIPGSADSGWHSGLGGSPGRRYADRTVGKYRVDVEIKYHSSGPVRFSTLAKCQTQMVDKVESLCDLDYCDNKCPASIGCSECISYPANQWLSNYGSYPYYRRTISGYSTKCLYDPYNYNYYIQYVCVCTNDVSLQEWICEE
jgi:hypothetical protein